MQTLLPLQDNICGAIGHTPVVRLDRLTRRRGAEGGIFAKLEYLNPGASKKDRVALRIIEEAEAEGTLRPGQPVVEMTSGNTGIGFALVCAIKGYRFIAVMSRGNSPERVKMIRALGGEVELVDQGAGGTPGKVSGDDLALVEVRTHAMLKELGAFYANQFHNPANARAYTETVNEIWEQCAGNVDVFLDFAGTGGTFAGCAAAFKKINPAIRCYLVEPEGAEFIADGDVSKAGHVIQGGGYKMALDLIDKSVISGYISVSDAEALDMTRALASEEGIFGGISAGANAAAALKLLNGAEKGASIAMLINDSGMKYLSGSVF